MGCCSFMSQSCKELRVGRQFCLSTACLLTSCKIIDFNNVKMSTHISCFCLGNDFFFQSKQLFTFFGKSIRLTFSAHEWSCQVMLLTWVKLLHEEKGRWRTPQERRVVSFWCVQWMQTEDTVPDHLYLYSFFQWKIKYSERNISILTGFFSTNYLFKEGGNSVTFLMEPFLNWTYLWLYSLQKKSLFNVHDLSKISHK